MITAHIPASYLLSTFYLTNIRPQPSANSRSALLVAGVLAGLAPDLDLIYYYLFDRLQYNHHLYWTHTPFYWVILLYGLRTAFASLKARRYVTLLRVITINVLFHLFLDTITGHIRWFYPIWEKPITFVDLPQRYDWWVWNAVFHWTFLIELVIWILALWVFRKASKARATPLAPSLDLPYK